MKNSTDTLSIVIPTYQREIVLIETIESVLELRPPPDELIVVDQTSKHTEEVQTRLDELNHSGAIRYIRRTEPSVTKAMNDGLRQAQNAIVLFLDDDIIPHPDLISAHLRAHSQVGVACVAGRVLQPWDRDQAEFPDEPFSFASTKPDQSEKFIGCNVSMCRERVLALGGFDENFVSVAYNFETELAYRLRCAGEEIYFEPAACIDHLKVEAGGTRSYGKHLTTARPDHAVGAYYCIFRTWRGFESVVHLFQRFVKSFATRYHLRRPWRIPVTLVAEMQGFAWAAKLALQGPRYVDLEK